MKHAKKIVLWTLLAFFLYAVITQPTQAAIIVQGAWNIIVQASKSIASFFNSILRHN